MTPLATVLVGLALGLFLGSFFEWLVHVMMHRRMVLGKLHTHHHKLGHADGFLWEWLYYQAGSIPAGIIIAAVGWWTGYWEFTAGIAVGGILYGTFAAYSHQLQHERPELVFWMPMPVHYIHHHNQQWRKNFGIGLDLWDRLFGTYQKADWSPDPAKRFRSPLDFLKITWW